MFFLVYPKVGQSSDDEVKARLQVKGSRQLPSLIRIYRRVQKLFEIKGFTSTPKISETGDYWGTESDPYGRRSQVLEVWWKIMKIVLGKLEIFAVKDLGPVPSGARRQIEDSGVA
jgi:hypothetical protein